MSEKLWYIHVYGPINGTVSFEIFQGFYFHE